MWIATTQTESPRAAHAGKQWMTSIYPVPRETMCVCVRVLVCVYHLFTRNNVGTIEYRSINKNELSA